LLGGRGEEEREERGGVTLKQKVKKREGSGGDVTLWGKMMGVRASEIDRDLPNVDHFIGASSRDLAACRCSQV
jgi:hypothetical protein